MKYVLLMDGQVLDQTITDNILDAARRGKVTPKAKDLLLVPDKRGTHKDKNGVKFKGFASVKKQECLRLGNLVLS